MQRAGWWVSFSEKRSPRGPEPLQAAEQHPRGESRLGAELARLQFLAVLIAQREDFDLAALRGDAEAVVAQSRSRCRWPLDLGEGARGVFAGVEQLQLLAVEQRPRARRRIAAADQVVDEIDVIVPVDARFGIAAPTFIARLRLVLRTLAARPLATRSAASSSAAMPIGNRRSKYTLPSVSSGPMGVSFCSRTGPSSSPSVGLKIVSPVRVSPRMIGQLMELGPR